MIDILEILCVQIYILMFIDKTWHEAKSAYGQIKYIIIYKHVDNSIKNKVQVQAKITKVKVSY